VTAPKHWEIFPLNALVEVLDNLRVPVNSSERSKRPGSVPYYGATGQVGTIDKAIFDEELLVLGEDGVQFFDPNKPKAYKIFGPAWVNNHAHVLRPKTDRVLQNFLLHFLNQFNYVGYANGTTRLKLTQGAMNSIPVPLPSLAEQHKIVELLEDHLSRLDAASTDVKQAKLKAAQFRNVYIDNFLKKPEGLKTNLASILKFTSGFAYKSSVWQDTGMPVVKIMNVKHREVNLEGCSFVSPEVAEISKSFAVRKGDLLFNMTGATLGAFGFYKLEQEARMNQRVGKFLPLNFSELNINYLAYFLESASTQRMIQQLAKGAAQPNISPTDILSLEINLPNFAVQSEIVEELDAGLSKVTQVDQLCNITDLESNALRRSLLQAAFTGQLTKEVVNV
jgi:type I restriction enzyme S subunit